MNEIAKNQKISLPSLQQWRNIKDEPVPAEWEDKWLLKKTPIDLGGSHYFFRSERPIAADPAVDKLRFIINCNKFEGNDGTNYEYLLISLEKLEEKLHLMSKYPLEAPDPNINIPYNHIEDELPIAHVFSHTDFEHDDLPY